MSLNNTHVCSPHRSTRDPVVGDLPPFAGDIGGTFVKLVYWKPPVQKYVLPDWVEVCQRVSVSDDEC